MTYIDIIISAAGGFIIGFLAAITIVKGKW